VNVHSVSATSISIILMVGAADEARAVRLLHDAFDLGGGG
jgi:aspartokinase